MRVYPSTNPFWRHCWGASQFTSFDFAFIYFFSNIQPLLPRKPLCFVFVFLFCCLDGVRQPPYGRTEEIITGLR
jgi:hypothetical protein